MSRALLHGLLFFLVVCLAASARDGAAAIAQTKPQVVEIDAERFSFTPSELRVKADTPVEFRLRSDDTDHGFRITVAGIDVAIPPNGRGEARVRFIAKEKGKFAFECSRPCGAGHNLMRGIIEVK